MNSNDALLIAIALRCLVACAAVAGAVYLSVNGKDGWGWLLALALVAIPTGIKFD